MIGTADIDDDAIVRAEEFVNAYCTANGRVLGPAMRAEVHEFVAAFIAQSTTSGPL